MAIGYGVVNGIASLCMQEVATDIATKIQNNHVARRRNPPTDTAYQIALPRNKATSITVAHTGQFHNPSPIFNDVSPNIGKSGR